jgi:NADH-quinone oxidoreductase subunit D
MLEVVQSMKLIRQAIERCSQTKGGIGEVLKPRQKLPKGAAYLETEAPKGQMGFMLIGDGSPLPWRVRIRSSSFSNLSVLGELCRGCLIADVPSIVGSLDLVLGETDR